MIKNIMNWFKKKENRTINIEQLKESFSITLKALDENDKHFVFILITNKDNDESVFTGIGCPGCALDSMLKMAINGTIKHNDARPIMQGNETRH